METGFSILMLCFAGMILIYALLLGLTKDLNMIPYRQRHAAKVTDKKAHAVKIAKILAITAAAPALGGLAGFISPAAGGIVIIAALPLCIWAGVKFVK